MTGRREVNVLLQNSFRGDVPFPRTGGNLNCSIEYIKMRAEDVSWFNSAGLIHSQ
jgi:hypothetical protein